MKVFLVGGAVRDALLGLPVKERDYVVVGATPEVMKQKGFLQVGKAFPVFLHPKTKEEYALARCEKKTHGGYHGFEFNAAPDISLEQDLQRRDLTINALASTPEGIIIDPYGGQKDLEQKVLRHVSSAFIEDPVRVLRVARFAARFAHLGFSIAPETLALMKTMTDAGELHYLVPERVWKECCTALSEQDPICFFQILHQCGAFAVLFPELIALYERVQGAESHAALTLRRATLLSEDPCVRWASFVHETDQFNALAARFPLSCECKALTQLVIRYHAACHNIPNTGAKAVLDLLERGDAMRRPERFKAFLLACQACYQGQLGETVDPYPPQTILMSALERVRAVDVRALIQKLNPIGTEALKKAIYQARLAAIQEDRQ